MSRVIAALLSVAACSIVFPMDNSGNKSFFDLYQSSAMQPVASIISASNQIVSNAPRAESYGQVIVQEQPRGEAALVPQRTDYDRFILRTQSEPDLPALANPDAPIKSSFLSSSRELGVGSHFYE